MLRRGLAQVSEAARPGDRLEAVLREAAGRGEARHDIPAGELAAYCLHALSAASGLSSQAALSRLINVTLTGVRACPGNAKAQ